MNNKTCNVHGINQNEQSCFSKKERLDKLNKLYNIKKFKDFKNNFFIVGGGSIGSTVIYLLTKVFSLDKGRITLFDKDKSVGDKLKKHYDDLVQFIPVHITKGNFRDVFKNIKKDDILIDCAYCLFTCDVFEFCNEIGCSYINSSIEDWCENTDDDSVIKDTLKYRCVQIEEYGRKVIAETGKTNTNFIVSMGCNPGNVSIWTKLALHLINNNQHTYKTFGELAYKLGIQTIHISEKDTQKTNKPKREGEYCNTWSATIESMYEEATAFAEGSWGTHEKTIPNNTIFDPIKEDNYLALKTRGMSTFLISYTPISKNYIGMMVRHDESFTIGRALSHYENDKLVYKPSVYYVYHPTDSTMTSFYELRERNLVYQDKRRLLTSDITEGVDELGLSIFLKNGKIYWIGSLLDIHEAREIFENKHNDIINATGLQVIAGYLAGILHIVDLLSEKKYNGVMCPDDLPYEKIFKYTAPFLGNFVIKEVTDWDFNMKYNKNVDSETIDMKNEWQFSDFLVDL